MKNKPITNVRASLISTEHVIEQYVLGFNLASSFKPAIAGRDLVHRSLIFTYLAQLIAKRDNNQSSAALKNYYTFLASIFELDVLDFDAKFFSSEAIDHSYVLNQMGYVIDISHQCYLSRISSEENSSVEFSGPYGYRKMRGAFYTPYEIASLIVLKTLNELDRNKVEKPQILDMGCGTGVFLSAMAHSLKKKNYSESEILNEMLFGSEVETLSAAIAKVLLQAELGIPLYEFANLNSIKVEDVIFGDLTGTIFEHSTNAVLYDCIVMNPPYDRLKADGGTESEKKLVAQKIKFVKTSPVFKNSSSGSIDLYRLFIDKSLALLKPSGVVGAIVPMSFIADKSACGLRKEFLTSNAISEIFLFSEKARIFDNVTQACSIFIANFNCRNDVISITQMLNSRESSKTSAVPLSVITSTSPRYLPIPFIKEAEIPLLSKLNQFPRIGDIGGITNRRGELDLTLDREYLGGLDDKLLKGISIDTFSINKTFKVDYRSFVSAKKSSSRVSDIFAMRIAGQQISNIDSTKRLKFALIPENYILGNSLNYLSVDEKLFTKNSFSLYSLLGFLNSDILNWRFKLTSSNNHVNNYELDDLPIPIDAPRAKIEALNKVVRELCTNTIQSNKELMVCMNTIVCDCYESTWKEITKT